VFAVLRQGGLADGAEVGIKLASNLAIVGGEKQEWKLVLMARELLFAARPVVSAVLLRKNWQSLDAP